MLSDYPGTEVAIGLNRSVKLIRSGKAKCVFLANDAERHFLLKVMAELEKHTDIPIISRYTAEELGAKCGIEVPCAIATVFKEAL